MSHPPLQKGDPPVRTSGLGVVLFSFWLLLSGHYTPLLLGLGVASSALVVLIVKRMDAVDDAKVALYHGFRVLAYLPWLLREVWRSNVAVARIILTPRLRISPLMVEFQASQTTDFGIALYANSITLTPGTVTTGVEGNILEIHALTSADVDGREEDEMDRRVTWVERGG